MQGRNIVQKKAMSYMSSFSDDFLMDSFLYGYRSVIQTTYYIQPVVRDIHTKYIIRSHMCMLCIHMDGWL